MPSKNEETKKEPSILSATAAKVFEMLAAFRYFFLETKRNFAEQFDWFLRHVEYLFIIYLWISTGLLFLTLGLFYLLIDYARVPRGVVFSTGGLVVLLAAATLLQTAKIKKFKR